MDLLDCEDEDDNDQEATSSETWLNSIDRGGLWHISDMTYVVFQAMEEAVRQQLRKSNTHNLTLSGGKHALVSKIASDEAVQFHWSVVAADFGEAEEKILLDMIIDLWVTIRGFSFVSGWIEAYKQSNKRNLQKSKALRSDLYCSRDSDQQ